MIETIEMALRSLTGNLLRTGLTVLGLMIGVAAFIAMVSFGHGARSSVLNQFEKLGVNMISISQARPRPGGRPPAPLSDEDVAALEAESDVVELVVPVASKSGFFTYEGQQRTSWIRATGPDYAEINHWVAERGGMIDARDMAEAAKVCVLGAAPVRSLFHGQDPIGKVIDVDGRMPCRVIGTLAEKGTATSGRLLDDLVIMPSTTYFGYLVGSRPMYSNIDLRPRAEASRADIEAVVSDTLRHRHGLGPGEEDDFTIRSNDDAIQVAGSVAGILTNLLASIAAVSLLVGGIGIMNIQLVAVAERTQEIGVRAAIGASPSQIMRQFLAEAVVLAMGGTLLGALIGSGISLAMATAMHWPVTVPLDALVGAIAFGAGVGVLFGFLPARRAAQLDPIDALRRE